LKKVHRNSTFPSKNSLHLLGFLSFLILPFSFSPGALDPSYHLGLIIWSFLSLGLVIWVSKGDDDTQRGDPFASLTRQKIFLVGGGFLLMSAFSLLRCVNIAEGIFVWLTFFLAGAFFLISSLILVRYPNGMLILSQWALGAVTGLVILGLAGRYWQMVQPNPFFFKGIMVNKNLYASSLFLLLPFVFHCLVAGRKLWFWTAAILLPALIITTLISLSRAVWLAMIFATVPVLLLMFCAFLGSRKKGPSVIPFVKKGALFFLFLLSLLWACLSLSQSVKNGETAQLRLHLWGRTVQMIQNELFYGVGPGQWRLVLPEYGQRLEIKGSGGNVEIIAQRPHNDLLSITAETGICGGICYLLFFGMLYYYAFKIVTRANPGQKNLVLAMVYGISGYLIISFFSYLLERPFHNLLMLLMAAAVVSSNHRLYPTKSKGSKKFCIIPLKSAMVILLMVCCLGSGLRLYSEIQLKKALQAKARGEWSQVVEYIDKVFLSIYSIDPFGVPLPWYRGMAHYNNNNLPMALKDFQLALVYHPYHDHSLNNVAVVEKMIQKP
jgi:O-antigen ligase